MMYIGGLIGMLIPLVIILIPFSFYLLQLQRALEGVTPANRRLSPGLVWLNLIPLFNFGWHAFTVSRLDLSLRQELAQRGFPTGRNLGFGVGLALSIAYPAAMVIPENVVKMPLGLAALVLWILYWVKIHEIAGVLRSRSLPPGAAPNVESPRGSSGS